MRVGLISDIHGNEVALDAVLEDMPSVDTLVCAGDIVGYNPCHAGCVKAVRERSIPTVMGNHDRAVVGDDSFEFNSQAGAGVRHARETLGQSQIEWLRALPDERTVCDGRVTLVHGHPHDPDRYTFPDEFGPDLLEEADVLVLGHTHIQHHAVFEEGIVVNPGSVGQPRDDDPRAAYAVLDLDAMSVTEHRTQYDIDRVVDAVRDTELPLRIGTRLRSGQ